MIETLQIGMMLIAVGVAFLTMQLISVLIEKYATEKSFAITFSIIILIGLLLYFL